MRVSLTYLDSRSRRENARECLDDAHEKLGFIGDSVFILRVESCSVWVLEILKKLLFFCRKFPFL